MRPASSDLIALLASTRQIVVWEEYTLFLANGDTLVYSTKDPDALKELPALPPPSSSWLLDTFAGSGTLLTHVGEIGAEWGVFPADSNLTDFVVSNGSVNYTGGLSGTVFSSGAPPNDLSDYEVTATFNLNGPPGIGFSALDMYGVNLDSFEGWHVIVVTSNSDPDIQIRGDLSNSTSSDTTGDVLTAADPSITHNMSVQLTNNRKTATFFFDGNSVGALTLADSATQAQSVVVVLSNPNVGSLSELNFIEGVSL